MTLLLVVSLAAAGLIVLGFVMPYAVAYLPGGLFLAVPGVACLLLASIDGLRD